MSLQAAYYKPQIMADTAFRFGYLNASDQAIAYLHTIAGTRFDRLWFTHEILNTSDVLFTSLRDSSLQIPLIGEIQTFDPDRFWRTVAALRTALRGTASSGLFQFYLYENGTTDLWRLDECAADGLEIEALDDPVHRARARFPAFQFSIRSQLSAPYIKSGGEVLMGADAAGTLVINGPLIAKAIYIKDSSGTIRGAIRVNQWGHCDFLLDGEFEAEPGKIITPPS